MDANPYQSPRSTSPSKDQAGRRPETQGPRRGNMPLLVILLICGFSYLAGVGLAATGAIHPPWDILNFFTFGCPSIAILIVCGVQLLSKPRPFTWPALIGFVLAMLLAAWLNFQALLSASAAV